MGFLDLGMPEASAKFVNAGDQHRSGGFFHFRPGTHTLDGPGELVGYCIDHGIEGTPLEQTVEPGGSCAFDD